MQPSVLFLTQAGATLPSVRFRVLPLVELGRARGLDIGWRRIPKGALERLSFFRNLPHRDVIVIQKKLFSGLALALLRRRCEKLAFDFDDAIWTYHPSEPDTPERAKRCRKNARRFRRIAAQADVVIAGNAFLAQRAERFRTRPAAIVPTPLDTDRYAPGPHDEGGRPVIGWMGTNSNLFFLPEVFRALAPCLNRARLLVICNERYSAAAGTPTPEFEFWSPERELAQLQGMDIGLMPLTDDEYTRGKCGFKILQYMACGAVPVASAVGFNTEIIEHGRNGLLVERPEQWTEFVMRLIDDPAWRIRLAAAARQTVVQKFGLRNIAECYWRALGV